MSEEDHEFWHNYNWDWKSPIDVKNFVDDALERDVYQYAWGALEDLGEENFYFIWWNSVQDAIKAIVQKFSEADLRTSIGHLLEGEFDECDPSSMLYLNMFQHSHRITQKLKSIWKLSCQKIGSAIGGNIAGIRLLAVTLLGHFGDQKLWLAQFT